MVAIGGFPGSQPPRVNDPGSRFQVGEQVAIYQYGHIGPGRVRLTTIDRLTATQYITATGSRFRRDTGRVVGGDGRSELRPTADKDVRRAIAEDVLSSLRYDLDRKLRAIDRLADPLAVLDGAEALIRDARDVITRLSNPTDRHAPEG